MAHHDFIKFPELTNSQMAIYYFESPHKQIMENFIAKVIKIVDGDTIRVTTDFRDFDFPVRFLNTDALEMNEGGEEARNWLEGILLDEEIDILIDPKQRVGKFGRLLGTIIHEGVNINQESIMLGFAKEFDRRNEGKILNINEMFPIEK